MASSDRTLDQRRSIEIWGYLKGNTSYVPPELNPSGLTKRRFQLFEIIFTKLVALLQSSFKWEVSPVQGDRGFDFVGYKELFSLSHPAIQAGIKIGGQCKYRSKKSDVVSEVSADLIKMLSSNEQICYIVIGYASVENVVELRKVAARLETVVRLPVCIFGPQDISALITLYLNELTPIINASLPSYEARRFLEHFSRVENRFVPPSVTVVSQLSRARTGVPLSINVEVTSLMLSTELHLRWIPEGIKGTKSPAHLIVPAAASSKEGILISGGDTLSRQITLKMIGYATGTQVLGQVHVLQHGSVVASVELGELPFADYFHPLFFWPPYESQRRQFDLRWSQVASGATIAMCVVGSAGSGKSRLCQELGFRAEQQCAKFVSIAHQNGRQQPYRLIGDLLVGIIGQRDSYESPRDTVANFLVKLDPKLGHESENTLDTLFLTGVKSTSRLNVEAVVRAILAVVLTTVQKAPLFVHLSDLHWAGPELLQIVGEVLHRLKHIESQERFEFGVMFILEGRTSEVMTAWEGGRRLDWSSASFEQFCTEWCDDRIALKPLNQKQSRGFLDNLFESAQSPHRRVPAELLPHQEILINQILRYAEGNPLHMVEQILLLRQANIVHSNPRTGQLFLLERLASVYAPPLSVKELTQNRFRHCQKTRPSLARLVRALALVEDRVERSVYEMIRARLSPDSNDEEVEQTEFVLIPENRSEPVRFRHENYYWVVRENNLDEADRVAAVDCYTTWLDQVGAKSAQALFLRATIIAQLTNPNRQEVELLLKRARALAIRRNEIQLALRIVQDLLAVLTPPNAPALETLWVRRCKLKRELARYMEAVGDRAEAADVLENLIREIEQMDWRPRPMKARRLCYVAQQSVCDLADIRLNLLHPHQSLKLLHGLLPGLNAQIEIAQPAALARWHALKARVVNRLAVAQALCGDSVNALTTAMQAIKLARQNGDISGTALALLDYGNICLAVDVSRGMKSIKRGVKLLSSKRHDLRSRYLAECTYLMGQMVVAARHSETRKLPSQFGALSERLSALNALAQSKGYVQEAGASALLAGICLAILGRRDAIHWFMECIAVCYRGNYRETLWRAHVNLAQFCLELGDAGIESAAHHADHALRLIRAGLTIDEPEERASRMRLVLVPLAQVVRIWRVIGDPRASELITEFSDLDCFFDPPMSAKFRLPNTEKWHADFIACGDNCYILY